MSERRAEALAFGALALAAFVAWLLVVTYPNYDSYYHLVWGRELLGGALPSFDAYAAPTPHPLWLAVSTLASLAGESGDRLLVLVCVLAHVAFTWAVFRLGSAVWDRRAGAAGALLAGSAFALLLYTARAYVDIPYLALVFWAAALEAERPRRGRPVLALLALAGLLRPEGWLLSGLYVLRLARAEGRWDRAALLRAAPWAAAPPLLWMLCDLLVTGDPFWSLNATSALAEDLGRDTGLVSALREGAVFLGGTAREPVAVGGLVGAALAWRRREGSAAYVLVALAAAGTAAFLLTSAAGLSVLPRYLTVPAVVLCLCCGYLVTRTRWLLALAVLGALLVVGVRSDVFGRLATELRFIRTTRDDLRSLVHDPRVNAARGCGPVMLPNYRLVPDTRWSLDSDQVRARSDDQDRPPRYGPVIVYTGEKLIDRYGKAAGASLKTNVPPRVFTEVATRGGLTAYASPGRSCLPARSAR